MQENPEGRTEKFWALKSFKEADIELSGIDLSVLLKNCMESGVELHMGVEGFDSTIPGRIKDLTLETIDLEIATDSGLEFPQITPIRVSLSDKGRLYRFDTRIVVRVASKEGGLALLTLALPDRIHSSQVRRALRIPASWSSDLKVRVDLDGRILNVDLHELSLGGFRCSLKQGSKNALQPDDLVTTILEFRQQRAELLAEVCGKHGDVVRFRFPEIDLDEDGEAPEDFRNLLTELGRAWTESKSRTTPRIQAKSFNLTQFPPNIVWLFP